MFGLERFHQYIYRQDVTVQSDHKPLEIIMKKPLHTALTGAAAATAEVLNKARVPPWQGNAFS